MGDTCLDLPGLPAPATRAEGSPSLGLEAEGATGVEAWRLCCSPSSGLVPGAVQPVIPAAWPQDREWAAGAPYLPRAAAGSPPPRSHPCTAPRTSDLRSPRAGWLDRG